MATRYGERESLIDGIKTDVDDIKTTGQRIDTLSDSIGTGNQVFNCAVDAEVCSKASVKLAYARNIPVAATLGTSGGAGQSISCRGQSQNVGGSAPHDEGYY